MKKIHYYYDLSRSQKLMIILYSVFLNLIYFLPLMYSFALNENTIGYEPLLVIFIFVTGNLTLSTFLERKQVKRVKKEVENSRIRHIKEFFEYIENDKMFINDVLHLDVKLYGCDRKEIGKGNVYSKLAQKRDSFFKEVNESN